MFVYISLCNFMKQVHKFLLGHFVAYLSIIQSNVKLLKQANATCCRCLRIVVRHFPARFGGHSFKAVVLPFCYFINQATYKRSFLRGSNMQYQCRHISLLDNASWLQYPKEMNKSIPCEYFWFHLNNLGRIERFLFFIFFKHVTF